MKAASAIISSSDGSNSASQSSSALTAIAWIQKDPCSEKEEEVIYRG